MHMLYAASTPVASLLRGVVGSGRAIPWDSASCLSLLGQMGQDSFFAVSNASLGCAVMGVADGVGGWRDNGVDSGEISRAIMRAARNLAVRTCSEAAASGSEKSTASFMLNPSSLLTLAYLDVKASKTVEAGSTTACIVALTPQPVTAMHAAAASSANTPNTPVINSSH
jgi:serine/threonine protein phosphatase PrpC